MSLKEEDIRGISLPVDGLDRLAVHEDVGLVQAVHILQTICLHLFGYDHHIFQIGNHVAARGLGLSPIQYKYYLSFTRPTERHREWAVQTFVLVPSFLYPQLG